jgi:hypothetical protein
MNDEFEKIAKQDKQREDLRIMQDAIRKHEAKHKLQRIFDSKRIEKTLETADLDTDWDELADRARLKALQREESTPFIFEAMSDFVQLSAGSLALFCAATGTGKSTLTANVAKGLIDAGRRVLIIVNEEENDDVGVRISCLDLNISIHKYKIKGGLTEAQREEVITNMVQLSRNNVTICGLDFEGDSRITTSPEGMKALLTRAAGKFDAIIVDYYQNVNISIAQPGLRAHEANEMFANDLDYFKNNVGCPILLMAQIRRGDAPYKERLEGRRLILNKCTDIFELKTEKEYSRSTLIVHKDRWLGNQGDERFIGYRGGKYVPYTQQFEEDVMNNKANEIEKEGTVTDEDFKIDKLIEDKLGTDQNDALEKARAEIEGKT